MSESTKFSTKVEFMDGAENDFKELHDAIKDGKAGQNEFVNDSSESSDNENLTNKSIQKSAADQDPASSSEEDETEPNPDQPGPRFLWAAQNDDRIEILKEILSKNPNVIKFADEDGYTALHRAAYSGSKVLKTNNYKQSFLESKIKKGTGKIFFSCFFRETDLKNFLKLNLHFSFPFPEMIFFSVKLT